MRRFFVPQEHISKGKIIITGSDVNHIKNVLRMKIGDEIEVLDGNGFSCKAMITEIKKEGIACEIIHNLSSNAESPIKITLAQCLPKGKKMDFVIEKATELGVKTILPVLSERSVPKIEEKSAKKISHWQKIAKEAAQQSRRALIPAVQALMSFKDLMDIAKNYTMSLVPWENETKRSLKSVLSNKIITDVLVLIGPEGGFSGKEIELAKKHGFTTISLGKRILRAETAAIVVLSQLFYALE